MYNSETVSKVYGALAKAQGSYKILIPNQDEAGGRFANLEAILKATREALSSNGLAFYQYIDLLDEGSGATLLKSMVCHESGEYVSSCARIVSQPTFRETFNAIECYRRLHALLLLGIAPSPLDPALKDDGGVEEFDKETLKAIRKPKEAKQRGQFGDVITNDQYELLMSELEGFDEITKSVHKFYGISTVADLPKSEFFITQARIRNLKKDHENYGKS
jgi:hypothetical protein